MSPQRAWLLQQLHAADERDAAARRVWTAVGIGAAGVVVGAAVAVLLTPKTGRQMRTAVATKAQAWVNPFGLMHEEVTRPEPLARIAADERAELAAKVRALNDDGIDVDTARPADRDHEIV